MTEKIVLPWPPKVQVKFCKKCQCQTERKKSGACKPCAAAWGVANRDKCRASEAAYRLKNPVKRMGSNAAYRAANKEKIKTSSAAYYIEKKDVILKKTAAWAELNSERRSETTAAWRRENPEKSRSYTAAWVEKNKEKVKANKSLWAKENADLCRIYSQNRRAKKRDNGGVLSKDITQKLFKLQKGKCACCYQPLGKNFQLDHIMPLALGGSNTDDNIQLLRQRCNGQKSAKHPVDFMQTRGLLL